MRNPEGAPRERSSVVEDIEGWIIEERGRLPQAKPGFIQYSVLAILVAFHSLIRTHRMVTYNEALDLLLFGITDEQRQRLGMTGSLHQTRASDIAIGQPKESTTALMRLSEAERRREYGRLANAANLMFSVIDPSPFHKKDTLTTAERIATKEAKDSTRRNNPSAKAPSRATEATYVVPERRTKVKMTVGLRKAILRKPDHPDRRIDDETSRRNEVRLDIVMNKIVAAAATSAPSDGWRGDLITDETLLLTVLQTPGHGTKQDHLLGSFDPDAEYWGGKRGHGKRDDGGPAIVVLSDTSTPSRDPKSGFGYGITLVARAPRPYDRGIPEVAVGIHIGRPTAGDPAGVRVGLEHATRHGLTSCSGQPFLIADKAYHTQFEWLPILTDFGYRPCFDHHEGWLDEVPLSEEIRPGVFTTAAVIRNSRLMCPGALGLTDAEVLTPHNEKDGPETPEQIIDRYRRTRYLEALSLPIKMPLRPLDKTVPNTKRSKNCSDPEHLQVYAITVSCPRKKINCPHKDGAARDPRRPDLLTPPHAPDRDDLPSICRRRYVTFQLHGTDPKRLQSHLHGSAAWSDMFRSVRSANEQYHSQWKNPAIGGVSTVAWLQLRGICKVGVLSALATAITTTTVTQNFTKNGLDLDGKALFGPREQLRRRRQEVIEEYRKQEDL